MMDSFCVNVGLIFKLKLQSKIKLNNKLNSFAFKFLSDLLRESFVGKYSERGFQGGNLKCAQPVELTAVDQNVDVLAAAK